MDMIEHAPERTTMPAAPCYRVDKFAVPPEGRDEFLGRVGQMMGFLRRQEGFVRDLVVEQESGPGVFNVVTVVEWAGPEVVARVRPSVAAFQREIGFDRDEMLSRLGIRTDLGDYRALVI